MRIYIFIFAILFISCDQTAQENNNSKTDSINKIENKQVKKLISYQIDTIADIKKGTKERSSVFIKKRLEKLVGASLKEICDKKGIIYPPRFILFRTFKMESEFEIWGANKRSDKLQLILTLPICAVDNEPSPKLERGDCKTPEGFYNSGLYYGSQASFMWIKLNNKNIDDFGSVNVGSSFKICLNYPNSLDRNQTKKIMKHNRPGSAICVHGNCITAGCISFKNKDYLPLFLLAANHNQKYYGQIKIHIFPFRFTDELKKKYCKNTLMTEKQILSFWNNLEEGYKQFETNQKALQISIYNNKYIYKEY